MYKLLVKSFLILFVFSACSKIIPIDIPDNEKNIAVSGLINSDSILNVNISKSISVLVSTESLYDDGNNSLLSKIDFVSDATVKIYENNVYKDTLLFTEYGNYLANFKPVVGNKYKIEVNVPNCEPVDAENTVPEKVEIISIETSTVSSTSFYDEGKMLRCEINFTDPSEVSNYYYLNVFGKATYIWQYMDSTFVETYSTFFDFDINDPMIDSDSKLNNGIVFNDEAINGETYTLKIEFEKYFPDSTMFHFNLYSISSDYYLFLKSSNKQKNAIGGGPFSEAVTVYSNINNGVGIFAGIRKSTYSILVRNKDVNY